MDKPLSASGPSCRGQISAHQAELAATPATNKARRQRLEWRVRNLQKRLAEVEDRLAGLQGRIGLRTSRGGSSDE
jgi:hypothetical protein